VSSASEAVSVAASVAAQVVDRNEGRGRAQKQPEHRDPAAVLDEENQRLKVSLADAGAGTMARAMAAPRGGGDQLTWRRQNSPITSGTSLSETLCASPRKAM